MRATATTARQYARQVEAGLASRLSVRRREVRDWMKLGGLATAMAAFTAMSRVMLG
jgi:hypothetical protein